MTFLNVLKKLFYGLRSHKIEIKFKPTRLHKEILLKNHLKEFSFITDCMPYVIWTASARGEFDFYNKCWYEYSGITKSDLNKHITESWTKIIHPDDYDRAISIWKNSIKTGCTFIDECRFKRASDNSYRWHLAKAIPMKDDLTGDIIKWVGTFVDIHEQKMAENELVIKSNELMKINEDLDNFIYTASHDLNAPINNIQGIISILDVQLAGKLNDDEQMLFNLLTNATDKFKKVISDLADLSKNKVRQTPVSFFEIIDEIRTSINNLIKENDVNIHIDLRVPVVTIPKKNLRSILFNLIINSIKYRSTKPPEISITTKETKKWVILTVCDNGIGFDMKDENKVYQAYERLHSHVEGSGVGLYMTKRIIEQSGGKIKVYSKQEQGTRFKIFFKKN